MPDNRGSSSAFNYTPPAREIIPEIRARLIEEGTYCCSWHPTDPYKFCNRSHRHHDLGHAEHFHGWTVWNGPYNNTRAEEATDE
jgi:hypothetical protein